MKKISFTIFLLLCILRMTAQVSFTALSLSPAFPKESEKVSFSYNADYSPLVKQKNITAVVYLFNTISWKALEPALTKKGNTYSATIQLDSNSSAIAIKFSAGEEKDLNGGKGYIIPVYDATNKPVKAYYLTASNLNRGLGEQLLGSTSDAGAALANLEAGKAGFPAFLKDSKFLEIYYTLTLKLNKGEARVI